VLALLLVAEALAAGGSDREVASDVVERLAKQPDSARLAQEPIDKARHALRRAADARAAADHLHGAELEALAREWAETGSDLVRAAAAEKKLAETQRELSETETRLIRARALLEESVARQGRAKQKLGQLEAERAGTGAK
jgi:chromosome segregation ATPase